MVVSRGTGKKISYNIGDIDIIITLLARLNASIFDYIRELVDNSLDSLWWVENQRESYTITITVDRKRNCLLVSDNAHGISEERLEQIPSQIGGGENSKRNWVMAAQASGESRKSKIARMRGVNQIGIHGWEIVGNACMVTSRAEGEEKTFSLLMILGENGKHESDVAPNTKTRSRFGTDVEITNIESKRMSQFNIKKLVEFLAQEYRKDLPSKRPSITIEIVEIDKQGKTKPRVYVSPVTVKVNDFKFNDGRTEKVVNWNSNGKNFQEAITWSGGVLPHRKDGRCRVWWHHRRIYNDVTEIEGFDCPPWNSGQLDMDFSADFCVPVPQKRDEFVDDPEGRFQAFKKGLRELEEPLKKFLAQFETVNKASSENYAKKLRNVVLDVFSDCGWDLEGLPFTKKSQLGGPEEVNTSLKKPRNSPNSGSGFNGNGTNPLGKLFDPGKTKEVDPNKPKKTAVIRPKFNVLPFGDETDPRRSYVQTDGEGRLVAVYYNTEHSDYINLVGSNIKTTEATHYLIDQLIASLYIYTFEASQKPEEIIRDIDKLRYAAYQVTNKRK